MVGENRVYNGKRYVLKESIQSNSIQEHKEIYNKQKNFDEMLGRENICVEASQIEQF